MTRASVVAYWQIGGSFRSIGNRFNPPLSYSTVRNIIVKFQKTGHVKNQPRSGRPKKLNDDNVEVLKALVLENSESRRTPLSVITCNLEMKLNIDISQNTVRRYLKNLGIRAHSAAVKPFISEKNAVKRVEWCKERLHWTVESWEKICWSDECSIEVRGTGTRRVSVWRSRGERFHRDCLAPSFKSGRQTIMVWGCFQGDKLGPLVVCPSGKMNAVSYCQILEKDFLPFWNRLGKDSIFMEDNAPIHTAKYSKNWRQEHSISSLPWPAQSPDLNPIENVWQQLKMAVEKRTPQVRNKEELTIALQEEWSVLQQKNSVANLIKSMPKRVQEVIKADGLPTKY